MIAFNQIHLDHFLKLSRSSLAEGKVVEPWQGKAPGPWLSSVGYNFHSIGLLDPIKKLKRGDVEIIIRSASVSDADASIIIFAWGGMTTKNAKSVIRSRDHWLSIVSKLRDWVRRGRAGALQARAVAPRTRRRQQEARHLHGMAHHVGKHAAALVFALPEPRLVRPGMLLRRARRIGPSALRHGAPPGRTARAQADAGGGGSV